MDEEQLRKAMAILNAGLSKRPLTASQAAAEKWHQAGRNWPGDHVAQSDETLPRFKVLSICDEDKSCW